MILINDVKYSCMECIRGHRSSTCKHHDRPLLQVRSKGRPGVYANGNPNHRVAVFAEEIATPTDATDSEDGSTATPPTTEPRKSCKSQPIVILKASSKQVIDLTNGEIVGPYDESKVTKSTVEKPPPQQPVINDESFIISSGCCAPKVTKRTGCGCCGNKKKNVSKSKILQTYIEKRLNKDVVPPPKQVKFISESPHQKLNNNGNSRSETPVFEVVPISSCSIPGTCCCGSDCKCAGCVVHGNAPGVPEQTPLLPSQPGNLPIDTVSNTETLVFSSLPNNDALPKALPVDANQQASLFSQSEFESTSQPSPGVCLCPPDACDCTNCEVHGIIDGHKLDEYFVDQEKLLNALVSDFDFNTLMSSDNKASEVKPEPMFAYVAPSTCCEGNSTSNKLQYSQMQTPSNNGSWSELQNFYSNHTDLSAKPPVTNNPSSCCSNRSRS
ncbi:Mac1 transcriptional regulator [Candida orthopsilosis Co 90-125]|uniref:Mac1 transcriptional regulator n=1 Tax=Candida orthopsilosis (strain 90-125) TaxID=1136231 RepID=H8XB15_CANO9|nr:Mac1 transcriptional regulator [Candida orthopsilosis Co 90-125]CCG25263.1 Mac1 transcriptional regulator [Candida orthopsilosis Co 90-125]